MQSWGWMFDYGAVQTAAGLHHLPAGPWAQEEALHPVEGQARSTSGAHTRAGLGYVLLTAWPHSPYSLTRS